MVLAFRLGVPDSNPAQILYISATHLFICFFVTDFVHKNPYLFKIKVVSVLKRRYWTLVHLDLKNICMSHFCLSRFTFGLWKCFDVDTMPLKHIVSTNSLNKYTILHENETLKYKAITQ